MWVFLFFFFFCIYKIRSTVLEIRVWMAMWGGGGGGGRGHKAPLNPPLVFLKRFISFSILKQTIFLKGENTDLFNGQVKLLLKEKKYIHLIYS